MNARGDVAHPDLGRTSGCSGPAGKAWLGLGYSLYTSLRRMHRLSQFGAAG